METENSEIQRARVLIVDDDQDTAECLQAIMSIHGYDTRSAFDGRHALAIAVDFKPDIAILDVCLPEFDGFQVARHLRRASNCPEITIVALTGLMSYASVDASEYKDFDHYLIKPGHPNEILQLLSNICASRTAKATAGEVSHSFAQTGT